MTPVPSSYPLLSCKTPSSHRSHPRLASLSRLPHSCPLILGLWPSGANPLLTPYCLISPPGSCVIYWAIYICNHCLLFSLYKCVCQFTSVPAYLKLNSQHHSKPQIWTEWFLWQCSKNRCHKAARSLFGTNFLWVNLRRRASMLTCTHTCGCKVSPGCSS